MLPILLCASVLASGAAPPAPQAAAVIAADELDDLRRDLRSSFPDRRRRALAKRAKAGAPGALDAALAALDDDEPEVADEAQLRLPALVGERDLRRLLGRDGLAHRDEWVRLRVAEALGRVELAQEGRDLLRHVDPRAPARTRALVWSVERLALAGRLVDEPAKILGLLEGIDGRRWTSELRAAAWSARAAVDPDATATALGRAFADEAPAVRVAALEALRAVGPLEARERALALRTDPAPAVRLTAIETLAAIGDRAALEGLVALLEDEPRERLAVIAVACLRGLTGYRYGSDPRPWRLLLAGLDEAWAPADRERAEPEGRTSARLAGLPILSDRVAFLIDLSGSIWREQEDGRTRKQVVDERLRAALEALPESAHFNLIPYSSQPVPWRERLAQARPATVREALAWFEELRVTGRGDVWSAVEVALTDPELDTIVLLGDGAPTGGHRWNLDLMMPLLVEERRYSKVAFDMVLVDARGGTRMRWQRLCDATGGRLLEVDL